MFVGTIVKSAVEVLGNPVGASGVVYEEYNLGEGPAVSVIFENGNYDGFSPKEQDRFLVEVGFSNHASFYQFTNVMKLSEDFRNGIFSQALEKKEKSK